MLELLATGFIDIMNPVTMGFLFFGATFGIVVGALPGMTGSMGIILLLPMTFYLPPHTAMILLSGAFCGSLFGGSVTAILLNTPGTPSAAATVLDGYPLCQQGKAGKAIGISAFADFVGGLFSTALLIFLAPQLARIALQFQAADYFSLAIFGLSIIASASGKNVTKGLIAGFFGLLISTVGIDLIFGSPRYTFGSWNLMGGLSMLPVLVGIFAMAQVFSEVGVKPREIAIEQKVTGILPTWKDIKGVLLALTIGCVIGGFTGPIPGTGGGIACWLAYNVLQRVSKNRDKLGTGSLEGVVAPESANSANSGGCMVPMLTLGIPGDAMTAVMLGGLILIGIRPGPQLFTDTPEIVYAIFAGWIVIQFAILSVGLAFAKFSPYILKVSPRLLLPIVAVFCVVGSFTLSNSLFEVMVTVFFGVIGVFMRKYEYPVAPLILGVILGPMAESNLNRVMIVHDNNPLILLQRPFSLMFLILAVVSIATPLITSALAKRKKAA